FLIFILILLLVSVFKKIIVYEFQKGLFYKNGKFKKELAPGLYYILRHNSSIKLIDTRICYLKIPGQEVLSSDNISLKVSLSVSYKVVNPIKAVNDVENYQEASYLTLQVALRNIISSTPVDEILKSRNMISEQLMEICVNEIKALGIELLSVNLKDIMFPGDLKNIFAQELKARKEGLATLERARGETAALRNL